MKAESEGRVPDERKREGSKVLRTDYVRRDYVRTVYVRMVVEPEGVTKFPPGDCRKASVHAATFSHFSHLCHGEPGRGWEFRWRWLKIRQH